MYTHILIYVYIIPILQIIKYMVNKQWLKGWTKIKGSMVVSG